MSKFLVVFVAVFAIGNASVIQISAVEPTFLRTFAPSVIPAIAPSVSVVRSYVPTVVPETELADWEAYKNKFGKTYFGNEDHFRRNLYIATKEKIAKYDELFKFGLSFEKLELNIFADYTRDELFSLRSILEESQDEWDNFKVLYGKVYDSFEDRFRKTLYFTMKDTIEAHNKLADYGFASYKLVINHFSDVFHDELPSGSLLLPTSAAAIPVTRIAYPYTSYPALRSISPFVYNGYYPEVVPLIK